jgi:hypothetical protein
MRLVGWYALWLLTGAPAAGQALQINEAPYGEFKALKPVVETFQTYAQQIIEVNCRSFRHALARCWQDKA